MYATAHSHPVNPGDELFCKGPLLYNGQWINVPEAPTDTVDVGKVRIGAFAQDSVSGGSTDDWLNMYERDVPTFIISKNGFAYKLDDLDVLPWTDVPKSRVYRAFDGKTNAAMTTAEKRCTWVLKYQG